MEFSFSSSASKIIHSTGFSDLAGGDLIMIGVGCTLIYLAIRKKFEPLLLLPMGFGCLLANLPLSMMKATDSGGLLNFFYQGVQHEILPPIIFMGVGALTDFGPLLANPTTLLLGAAAQIGVYTTLIGAVYLGFNMQEAAAIGIIGGADGPTSIFIASKLAPHLLAPIAVDHGRGTEDKNGTIKANFANGKNLVPYCRDLCLLSLVTRSYSSSWNVYAG